MTPRKGIILSGGLGTRLYPITITSSKQLLPVYDKPMIYYPLSLLMLAGIREMLVITTEEHQSQFQQLLGNGKQWGIKLTYMIQKRPEGIAHSLILAEEYLDGGASALVLGDNIFYGNGLPDLLKKTSLSSNGATIFSYKVSDPENYGVVSFDDKGNVRNVIEKPSVPTSDYAVVGLYFFDSTASTRAKKLRLSSRRELEITSLIKSYISDKSLSLKQISRGVAWFDAGNPKSLLEASNFVRTLTERQGMQVGSPEEVAFKSGWIEEKKMSKNAEYLGQTDYAKYLKKLIN
jgi:glucose-1-phosphate thymidylyltransferase